MLYSNLTDLTTNGLNVNRLNGYLIESNGFNIGHFHSIYKHFHPPPRITETEGFIFSYREY